MTTNALAQASGAGRVEETTGGCTASPGALGSTAGTTEKGNNMDATLQETIIRMWSQGSNTWVIAQRSGAAESDVIDVVSEEQKKNDLKTPNVELRRLRGFSRRSHRT